MMLNLNNDEMLTGALQGIIRQLEAMRRGAHDYHGAKSQKDGWQIAIEGALGEMAVAKMLDVFWTAGGHGQPDVGDVDVRTTWREDGHLILHPHDHDDRRFYLVTGSQGEYHVRGWIYGRDGKNPSFWRDPAGGRPAYFVPQIALNRVDDGGE